MYRVVYDNHLSKYFIEKHILGRLWVRVFDYFKTGFSTIEQAEREMQSRFDYKKSVNDKNRVVIINNYIVVDYKLKKV